MDAHEAGGEKRPGSSIRRLFVESPTSIGARARARRWELLQGHFPDFSRMRVVDLGGTVSSWERAPVRPAHVTVLNVSDPGRAEVPWITAARGDACRATGELRKAGLADTYDLVYSNSVIEHLGGHAMRAAFAAEVHGLASRHWIQTPYRFFPVEPHWLFPGMQFLPLALRVRLAWRWPLSHTRPQSLRDAKSQVMWTELIGVTDLKAYFPESVIVRERVLGLTKSIMAVNTGA